MGDKSLHFSDLQNFLVCKMGTVILIQCDAGPASPSPPAAVTDSGWTHPDILWASSEEKHTPLSRHAWVVGLGECEPPRRDCLLENEANPKALAWRQGQRQLLGDLGGTPGARVPWMCLDVSVGTNVLYLLHQGGNVKRKPTYLSHLPLIPTVPLHGPTWMQGFLITPQLPLQRGRTARTRQ